ncbi:MAG: dTMP kinase, partial [Planctomycetes bacterium]|nr:dTMP kinase [Planctomycetota bacterium]
GRHLPDRVFVLDVPVAVASARRAARAADRIETRGPEYLERVRAGFRRAPGLDPRAVLVDAAGSFDAVQATLRDAVERELP